MLSNYKQDLCAFLPVDALGEPAIRFVLGSSPKKAATQFIPLSSPAESLNENLNYPEVKLNNAYRFESFIEGPANQFVKSVAMGVASRPGLSYNPLFIHGEGRLG